MKKIVSMVLIGLLAQGLMAPAMKRSASMNDLKPQVQNVEPIADQESDWEIVGVEEAHEGRVFVQSSLRRSNSMPNLQNRSEGLSDDYVLVEGTAASMNVITDAITNDIIGLIQGVLNSHIGNAVSINVNELVRPLISDEIRSQGASIIVQTPEMVTELVIGAIEGQIPNIVRPYISDMRRRLCRDIKTAITQKLSEWAINPMIALGHYIESSQSTVALSLRGTNVGHALGRFNPKMH